ALIVSTSGPVPTSASNTLRDRVAHGRGADSFNADTRMENVACAITIGNGFAHRVDDGIGSILELETMPEHQGSRHDLRNRVGQVFAGDARGCAAGRFVEAEN